MIITILLKPITALLFFLIGLIPQMPNAPVSLIDFVHFLKKGLYFFDANLFFNILGVVFSFMTIQMAWAIVEWIYKKIPFVNLK